MWTLYYDGGCNLCHASKLRAEKWAEQAKRPLNVDILQSDAALAKGFSGDAMILEADGKVFEGADAWLKLMELAPWYLRWISWARVVPPARWMARLGYGVVARLRFKLFGTRACQLPAASKQKTGRV